MQTLEKKWTGTPVDDAQLEAWVDQFNRDGYLVLHDILPPDLCAQLRADLDTRLVAQNRDYTELIVMTAMFENSKANLSLFDWEPIVSFAEKLVAPDCHVIHNNSFVTPKGTGLSFWHQDDQPHYVVTDGEPPRNVMLPVLWFTANYYLTDVETPEHGPTQVIPASHLFGTAPNNSHLIQDRELQIEGTELASKVVSCVGKAGSVVLFNNQTWHRGAPNQTDRIRYITQITYGRRMIGHMYAPFMNYVMPEHVYRDADPRLRRLVGFKHHGPYG